MILKALPDTSLSSGELKLYAYPDPQSDEPVGCVELYNYDPVNRRAAVGIVVSNEHRHLGYGKAMIQELTRFCQESTSLHQIYADIAVTNTISIRIFQQAGYQHCATMHDWVARGDNFIDTLRFQLLFPSSKSPISNE